MTKQNTNRVHISSVYKAGGAVVYMQLMHLLYKTIKWVPYNFIITPVAVLLIECAIAALMHPSL